MWPVRLSVRTPGFQPGKRGSIPLRAATSSFDNTMLDRETERCLAKLAICLTCKDRLLAYRWLSTQSSRRSRTSSLSKTRDRIRSWPQFPATELPLSRPALDRRLQSDYYGSPSVGHSPNSITPNRRGYVPLARRTGGIGPARTLAALDAVAPTCCR